MAEICKIYVAFISTPKLFHFMLSWHAFFVHYEPRVNQIFLFAKISNTDKILLTIILSLKYCFLFFKIFHIAGLLDLKLVSTFYIALYFKDKLDKSAQKIIFVLFGENTNDISVYGRFYNYAFSKILLSWRASFWDREYKKF